MSGQPDIALALRTCTIPDCGRTYYGRGWCSVHYGRWRRTGSAESPRLAYRSSEDAFLARTEPLPWSGCLIWTGALSGGGYGSMRVGGQTVLAHRYAWEQEFGPIPPGMHLDHRYHCNKACCELSHLRLTTPGQNFSNRNGPQGRTATGVRNVHRGRNGGFKVQVQCRGKKYGRDGFSTIEEARAFAARLREELFGEYGGADVRSH